MAVTGAAANFPSLVRASYSGSTEVFCLVSEPLEIFLTPLILHVKPLSSEILLGRGKKMAMLKYILQTHMAVGDEFQQVLNLVSRNFTTIY